jgi:hypothetical protein
MDIAVTRNVRTFASVLCVYACAGGGPTTYANVPPSSSANGKPAGTQVALRLDAIHDPHARGLDSSMLLRVTVENSLASEDRVLVDEGLITTDIMSDGVLQLDLRAEGVRLEHHCLVNASSRGRSFVDLGPGEALTRLISISCYRPPKGKRLTAVVTYRDRRSALAQVDGAAEEAPAVPEPCEGERDVLGVMENVFRGQLVSNKVEFIAK